MSGFEELHEQYKQQIIALQKENEKLHFQLEKAKELMQELLTELITPKN